MVPGAGGDGVGRAAGVHARHERVAGDLVDEGDADDQEHDVPDQRAEHDPHLAVAVRRALELAGQVHAPPVPHHEGHDHEHGRQRRAPVAGVRGMGRRRGDDLVEHVALAAELVGEVVEVQLQ